jgi:hypothetical protein
MKYIMWKCEIEKDGVLYHTLCIICALAWTWQYSVHKSLVKINLKWSKRQDDTAVAIYKPKDTT